MTNQKSHIQFSFTSIAAEEFRSSLASAFDCKIENSLIPISPDNGQGTFFLKEVDKDFFFFSADVVLKKDLICNKQVIYQENHRKSFTVSYILRADNVKVVNTILGEKIILKQECAIFFVTDESGIRFELPAGEEFKLMSFNVSEQWLRKELNDTHKFYDEIISKLCYSDKAGIFIEAGSIEELKILSDIETQISSDPDNILSLKAKVFSLVSKFFLKDFQKTQTSRDEFKLSYSEKMLEVEKILIAHLEKKLPDLKSIARERSLSVSTLKRHFKMAFGKNIYEYYLELKMEHAKRLLMENPLTVNEVATKLDYGKVSSFIGMFKKHYGICPGGIRRKFA